MLKVVAEESDGSALNKTGQVDAIVDLIVERIRYGEYVEGQQLVARSIASEMNVSVVPVREALARLAGEGVVELLQNRSPRIKRLSRKEVLDALEVWEVNAGLIARLAAQKIEIRGNKTMLLGVRKAIKASRQKKKREDLFSAIIELHAVLSKIVDNAYVERVKLGLHTELWTKRITDAIPDEEWPQYVDDFIEIVDAICEGDSRAAETSYRRHIKHILMRADSLL